MGTDLEHIRNIAQRVAESSGLELVDVELRGGGGKHRMLRLVIDRVPGRGRPGYTPIVGAVQGAGIEQQVVSVHGVTHEDCAAMSREVSAILDVEDAVSGGSYTLEVSSTGLDRKLVKAADFERFTGSRVKLMTREPIAGNRHFEGRLESFSEGRLVLDVTPREKKGRKASHPVAPKAAAQGWGTEQEAGKDAAEGGRATRVEIDLANVERANLVPEI